MSGRRCGRLAAMAALVAVIWTVSFAAAQSARTAGNPVTPVPRTVSFEPLIQRLVAGGRSEASVRALFSRPEMVFDPEPMTAKLTELYMSRYGLRLVVDIQSRLAELGYHPWPATGKLSRLTKWAIRAWQRQNGLPEKAQAAPELLDALRADKAKAPPGLEFPPEEAPPVYESALTEERLAEAREFFTANRGLLAGLRRRYGLPEEVAVGVAAVETRCGRYLGEKPAVVVLSGMALARDYSLVADAFGYERPSPDRAAWLAGKARERGDWAFRELAALLDYAGRIGRDPLTIPGSIYGAIGISQFMPTSALSLARDGDGDGVADLFVVADALESMGNYLQKAGVGGQTSETALREALFRYNKSRTYVNTIMAVAEHLRRTAPGETAGQ
jgi:membrane-bound lytic murein transglycosylase B